MVVDTASPDRVFQALADPTRRDILDRTLRDELSVTSLAREYPMSFAAVQKHVAALERAALVSKRRQGREALVRGNVGAVRAAARELDRLEEVWRSRVRQMDALLGTSPPNPKPKR